MIPIQTKPIHSYKQDASVVLSQKIVKGPDAMLDRKVSLLLTPKEAAEMAIRILKELIPAYALDDYKEELKKLSDHANR